MNQPRAAIIIIGNEILSGRTLDTNTREIILTLAQIGVVVIETRTIADDRQTIIDSVRELSGKYDYVFTTGGIGPTHDDITPESIAEAFGVEYQMNDQVYDLLKDFYQQRGQEFNEARQKMAYFPKGAILLSNSETTAPGFMIENVCVFAGTPRIMKAMLNSAIPLIRKGKIVYTETIDVWIPEGVIAKGFAELQEKYPAVAMGSYPFSEGAKYGTSLVLKSDDKDLLDKAFMDLKEFISIL